MINIYLADDHTLLVEGMNATLNTSDRVRIVRSFSTLDACRRALTMEQPDILLLDISMPDGDGVAFCKELTETYPQMKVIALTMHDECALVSRVLKNGAKGYVLKSVSSERLLEAIEEVYHGKIHICQEIAAQLRKYETKAVHLTPREQRILKLLSEGCNSNQIAEQLFIDAVTVKWHRRNLLAKFGVNNTNLLIAKVIKEGLI